MGKSLSKIAYDAARIASERGHCKDMEEDEEGHVCFVGAVNLALTGEVRSGWKVPALLYKLLYAAGKVLQSRGVPVWNISYEAGWEPVPHAITWNNLEGTTGEDVVLLLKETGALLEAEENAAGL